MFVHKVYWKRKEVQKTKIRYMEYCVENESVLKTKVNVLSNVEKRKVVMWKKCKCVLLCLQENERLRVKQAKEDLEKFLLTTDKINSAIKYR